MKTRAGVRMPSGFLSTGKTFVEGLYHGCRRMTPKLSRCTRRLLLHDQVGTPGAGAVLLKGDRLAFGGVMKIRARHGPGGGIAGEAGGSRPGRILGLSGIEFVDWVLRRVRVVLPSRRSSALYHVELAVWDGGVLVERSPTVCAWGMKTGARHGPGGGIIYVEI